MTREAEEREQKAKTRISEIKNIIQDQDKMEIEETTSKASEPIVSSTLTEITSHTTIDDPKDLVPEIKTHLKMVSGSHHSVETNPKDIDDELKSQIESFKNRNAFGHSSDSTLQNILYKTDAKIEPPVISEKDVSIHMESTLIDTSEMFKPHLKMVETGHHSQETTVEKLDNDIKSKLDAFKSHNIHGHSSNSSIQELMYPQQSTAPADMKANVEVKSVQEQNLISHNPPTPLVIGSRPHLKMSETGHHSVESNKETILSNSKKRIDLFRNRNSHGHASDSSLQYLLYSNPYTIDEKSLREGEKKDFKSCFKLIKKEPEPEPEPESDIKIQPDPLESSKTDESKNDDTEIRTHIKIVENNHPSNETNVETLDEEAQKRIDSYKYRNYHGHSSDSTIQQLMYSGDGDSQKPIRKIETNPQNQQPNDNNLISQYKQNQLDRF